jgi:DNA-binding MarR family transcriptional regulator
MVSERKRMTDEPVSLRNLATAAIVSELLLEMSPLLRQIISVEAMASGGLTMAQARVLRALARGPRLSCEIARELRITPPTASEMVDLLVRRGLVERHDSPGDRRVTLLQLTAAGKATSHLVRQRSLERLQEILARLDSEDVYALEKGLGPLIDSARQNRTTAHEGKRED